MTAREKAEQGLKWAENDLKIRKGQLRDAQARFDDACKLHSFWQRELAAALEDELKVGRG